MVLVVEDHPVTLQVIAALLRKRGHDARTAPSGHAAIHVLSSIQPDLIVLDMCMPDVDGLYILHKVRRDPTHFRTPVVIFSASEHHAEVGMLAGAQAAFIKGSVSWERFLGHIDQMLHHNTTAGVMASAVAARSC